MKAELGKIYARIHNGKVAQIFDINDLKEWNEEHILCVELSEEQREWVSEGDRYDTEAKCFIEPSLEEAREQQLFYINNRFESEIAKIKSEYIPQEELATWDLQFAEAQSFLKSKSEKDAPLLALIASQRGQDLESLSQKVVEKSQSYREKAFTLIGYRQKLVKAIESAQSVGEVADISYTSPYGFE